MPTRCNRSFLYCRTYCLFNMFRVPLCPSSGAQEYYTVVAACGIWCCGFQVVGPVRSGGLCVRFAGCCSVLQTGHITSVASSWHFISTYHIYHFFIADLIACSTCFGHHCVHRQELKSIIQWLLPVVFGAVVFK